MATSAAAHHKTAAIHAHHVHRNRQASAHGAGIEQLLVHGAIELLVTVAAASDLFRPQEALPVVACGLRALGVAFSCGVRGRTWLFVAQRLSALADSLALIVAYANEHVSENGALKSEAMLDGNSDLFRSGKGALACGRIVA
jgi:hypothetical protein